AMLKAIEGNGVRTIIVETASRFARDLMVQEVGHAKLRERGIDLIAADNPGSFIDDTPTAKLVRQVLGAISEFDKAMTVAKLRGARRASVGTLASARGERATRSCNRSWSPWPSGPTLRRKQGHHQQGHRQRETVSNASRGWLLGHRWR